MSSTARAASSTARATSPRSPRTTTRPSTAGATRRTSSARATSRPALTAAPSPAASVAGNGVFALVIIGILLAGMVLLLLLNTTLAQGAFEINSLTRTQSQLAVTEQQLLQEVARAEAPDSLQQRATALGMVPVTSPVFLRLADGAVLGTPTPAAAPRAAGPNLPTTGRAATTTAATTAHDPMAAVPVAAASTAATTRTTSTARTTTAARAATTTSSDGAVPVPAPGGTR